MRTFFYGLILTGLLFCLVSCDKSIPPGVNKDEVEGVPAEPHFNASIRPLLWKLAHQEDASSAQFWKKAYAEGLSLEMLKNTLKNDNYQGVANPVDLTLIWRWAQGGGSVDEPSWLYSALPEGQLKEQSGSQNTLPLTAYFLGEFSEMGPEHTAFRSWFKGQLAESGDYRALLQSLLLNTPVDAQVSSGVLASSPAKTFHQVLGGSVKLAELETLFSDFNGGTWKALYTADQRRLQKEKDTELARYTQQEQPLNPSYYENWASGDPAYVPLRNAQGQLSFSENTAVGYFGSGFALTPEDQVLVAEINDLSALSAWTQGAVAFTLNTPHQSLEIEYSAEFFSLSLIQDERVIAQYQFPLLSLLQEWNHLLLAQDYTRPNGFSLSLNGQEITPARSFPLPSLKTCNLTMRSSDTAPASVDEIKLFTRAELSPLEKRALYDYTAGQLSLDLENTTELVTHFNYLYNEEFQSFLKTGDLLREEQRAAYRSREVAKVLPAGMDFQLEKGRYFKEGIPLEIESGDLSEFSTWLTTDATPWVARATVDWAHKALTGKGLINYEFPGQTLPENWEKIDQWAADFIKNAWSLEMLVAELKAEK